MQLKLCALIALISFTLGTGAALAHEKFQEAKARAACAKGGWPGYPDNYQEACVWGARWQAEQ